MSTTILRFHLKKMCECAVTPSRCWEGPASLKYIVKYFQEVAEKIPQFERQALEHSLTKLEQYFTYGPDDELTNFDAWIYSRFIREQLWKL